MDALKPPSGPWARRKPNSSKILLAAVAERNRAAFVATKLAKFTRVNNVVSNNWALHIGPSIRINGIGGNTAVP